jgi:diguanylate cyclase (GGDEF)-like protein
VVEAEGDAGGALTSDELAAAILRASRDAFIVLDEAGVIRFASEGIRKFREVPQDLVGRAAVDIVDPGWIEEVAIDLEAAFTGKIPGGRVAASEIRLADGTRVLAELLIHRPEDPRVGALVVQVHDVPSVRPMDDFLEAMSQARGLHDLLQPVMHLARADAPAEGCSIFWRSIDGSAGEHIGAGVDLTLLTKDRFAPEELPWLAAGTSGEPVVIGELEEVDTEFAMEVVGRGFGSIWSLPVPVQGDHAVVLSVWRSRKGPLSSTNQLSVNRALHMTSVAFERHRAEEQLRHAALHDPLTGAPNRTLLDTRLDSLIDRPDRSDAVLVLDLDGFKQVNDRYGHAAGDLVLRTVVQRLDHALRPGDLLARLGGDEFAVVCTSVGDESELTAIARRLLDVVTQPLDIEGRLVRIGASIGVSLAGAGQTGDQLLRSADEALIAAKRDGKGTIRFASPPEPQLSGDQR